MQRFALYVRLMRLDKPIGIWLVFFPAAWAVVLASCVEGGMRWDIVFACLVGAGLVRSAGCIINDLTDRKLDAHVARTASRPLASGAVSVREALVLLFMLLLAALGIALQLEPLVLVLAFAVLPFIAAYPWMKRFTWWPQAFLGITFNAGALIGWAAVTGELSISAWLLYAGALCWTFGYDTIYALQDMQDDIAAGIKSSARALGRHLVLGVTLSYLIFLLCLIGAGLLTAQGWPYFVGLMLAALQLGWQVGQLRPIAPERAGMLFNSNRYAGLVVLIGALLALYV